MKKLLSLLLSLTLLLGLSASAFAEAEPGLLIASNPMVSGDDGQDEAMKQVILTVKKTLGLNTDDYTEFNGDSYVSGNQVWWHLSWYSDDGSISVTADENGKVYSCYFSDYNQSYVSSKGLHFPAYCYADAVEDADGFVQKLLDREESIVWEKNTDSLYVSGRYYLYGTLYLKGLPTEIGVSVTLNTADGSIQSFYRYDGGTFITGEVPSEVPAFDAETARGKFAPAVSSELQWVITDYETMEARLMYVFTRDYGTVLDAQTGELIGSSGSRNYDSGKGEADNAASEEATEYDLTEVEIKGAEKYIGVLDDAALLAAAKAEAAFGITDAYTIGNVRYTANQSTVDPLLLEADAEIDEGITASYALRYVLTGPDLGLSQKEYDALLGEGYTPTVSKSVTADAHTGEVKSLYTYYSGFGWEERKDTAEPVISDTAQNFLNDRYGAYMSQTRLEDSYQSSWGMKVDSFRYVRVQDGYPLYDNSIRITVNTATGYVDSFNCYWDEDVSFGPSAPLVGEDTALASYLNTYEAELFYSLQAEEPDNWETGYYWLLAYRLESEDWCWQVDAITGEADVERYDYGTSAIAYTDLGSSYAAREIEELAQFGIGFYGVEQFLPKQQVTELDMILFLLSADGYAYDYNEVKNYDAEELNWIYRIARDEGFISTTAQNPDRLVKRSELCRSFVALAELTEAAELKGIYACGFTDEETISEADYGYVAIAKGLGIVSGDKAGTFRPNDGATRQELALMLYRYLSR